MWRRETCCSARTTACFRRRSAARRRAPLDKSEPALLAASMRHILRNLLTASLACVPAMASACLYPPPSPPRPDETQAQYQARATAELNAYLKDWARKEEARYFAEAKQVYLARIVRSEEIRVGGTPFARRATLRPLEAIRGTLPPGRIEIRDRELTSCGLDGDGPAAWGGVSHMAIVFDGVDNGYRSHRYAILASEAQHAPLVQAWTAWKARSDFTYDE